MLFKKIYNPSVHRGYQDQTFKIKNILAKVLISRELEHNNIFTEIFQFSELQVQRSLIMNV